MYWTTSEQWRAFIHILPDRTGGITLELAGPDGAGRGVEFGGEAVKVMRRQFVSFAILGLLAGVPLAGATADDAPAPGVSVPVAVQRTTVSVPWLRDEAAMVLVGTALIGLAAAVRRAA
jgi:hypothetical protein